MFLISFLDNIFIHLFLNFTYFLILLLDLHHFLEFDDAACALIRGLPYCTDRTSSPRRIGDWYYDFLEACLSHGYTRMIPRYIDADYNTDLGN